MKRMNIVWYPLVTLPILISACDPESVSVNQTQSEATGNGTNTTYEVLSSDYAGGTVNNLGIVTQGDTTSDQFGTVKVINKDEPFSIEWDISVSETSDLAFYFKQPANPDGTNGGFFGFNTCEAGGGCTDSSTLCEYSVVVINGDPSLGSLICDWKHPDLEVDILNAPDLGNVLERSVDDLPEIFELRANLCGNGACDIIRVDYVQINP